MKSTRNRWLLVLGLPMVIVGCESDLTGINENPNGPTDVGPQYLLPAAIQESVNDLLGTGLDRNAASLWVQHIARLQYGSPDRYDLGSTFADSYWEGLWTESLPDAQLIIERSAENEQPNLEGIGRVLKSWIVQNMTDLWGDIPYSTALQGHAEDRVTTPAYDTQASIYASLLTELEAAASLVVMPGEEIGTSDLIYNGDAAKWAKFANSLRLRTAMRLSEVDAAAAQAGVAAAVAAGVFEGAVDEAKLSYPGTAPNENPMYVAFRDRPGDFRASETMVNTLTALADPRLEIYADPAESTGLYVGMPNGLDDSHGIGFTTVSKVGAWFLKPDAPAMIQSYAEVLFLKAEAAARGWIAEDAASLYAAGITASMERYGISQAEIATYLAHPEVVYSPGRGLEQIALQKWIELYDVGPEAYAEWRRTGFPNLVAGRDNVTGGMIPLRFPYPTTEASLNRTNLEAAKDRQSGALISVPIWWDVD
ncbi:MAG: SusD/RagB family nutrient-binding outer membrane lipoprotein [Gemmatimonas sp.]|nr:SusD/RagB family nutrient-binding outer membrane lipoprotein [Gemmatimonas sp.]